MIREILCPDPLDREDLDAAAHAWQLEGGPQSLMEWLVGKGHLSREDLHASLLEACGREALDPASTPCPTPGPEGKLLQSAGYLVLADEPGRKIVAGGSSIPADLVPFIGEAAGEWKWVLVTPLRPGTVLPPVHTPSEPGELSGIEKGLTGLLSEAVIRGATDVHFERTGGRLDVRVRRGIRLEAVSTADHLETDEKMAVLKRWAGFSTADRSLPQDGQIMLKKGTGVLSFRASLVGTVDGESMVLRHTGSLRKVPGMEALGVPAELASLLRDSLVHQKGLTVLSGTTCSGKTTTAYSLLNELSGQSLKILTIEDPVEYALPGIVQSGVDEKNGWGFHDALRAYLRQDPDILLIGEIRDHPSAAIACRAGLTGHAVLATLHARGLKEVMERLGGWINEPGLVSEALHLIVHQTLSGATGSGWRKAGFSWIRPDAGETLAFLRSGRIPEKWLDAAGQDA